MNLSNVNDIKKICKLHNIKPLQRRGQNFLISEEILERIVKAANLKKDEIVLEVGPGLGVLTIELVKHAKKVIAVEIDKKLTDILKINLKDCKNVEVVNNDILKLKDDDPKFPGNQYKIIANLPYGITSVFLRKFLSNQPKPKEMILMLQKEVAQRICANVGKMSLLSVSVQFYAKPEILFYVNKDNFWPKPKVDSAVIKISQISDISNQISEKEFFKIVKIGFSARRKQLQNNLSTGLKMENEKIKNILKKMGFDVKIRAQELAVSDWIKLAQEINSKKY